LTSSKDQVIDINMTIILDGIVFSLQYAGGISLAFSELLKRLLNDKSVEVKLLEHQNNNMFRRQINVPAGIKLKPNGIRFPLVIDRYINPYPSYKRAHGIFHSSYYRTARNKRLFNVTTVHDFTYEYYRNGLPRMVHHAQKASAIKNAQKIICVSETTRLDLLRFFPGIQENLIEVIYNGVDDVYKPLPNEAEGKLKAYIPFDAGEYMLYVGDRAERYKNFNYVAAAARIARVPLVVIGGGAITQKERWWLDTNPGINNYHHLTDISSETLNVLYNHALCLVYPSSYEGFGIPVVEAQKAGCPVIGSNAAAIKEVAGEGAVLLDQINQQTLADAIIQLKGNTSLIRNMIDDGLVNARRFSWDDNYIKIKKVYQESC
jgi:glycosyltransferase involved in cell wall biosynthesis